jgi:guanylate kinase
VSATTRVPRVGEVDGKEYYFLNTDDFEARIKKDHFVETAKYAGNYYGTLKSEITRLTDMGHNVLLEIEVEGALNVLRIYPEALSIFMMAPSFEALKTRLQERNTETMEAIERRLEVAREEMKFKDRYGLFVINDDPIHAAERISKYLNDNL